MRLQRSITILGLLGLTVSAIGAGCGGSDDDAAPSGGSTAGSGTAGSSAGSAGSTAAGAAGSTAGAAGTSTAGAAGTSAGAAGAAGAGGTAGAAGGGAGASGAPATPSTSMMCGAVPVLGPQAPEVSVACVTCVDGGCCTEGAACGANAECKAYRGCLATCTDSTCTSKCAADHPTGTMASDTFVACRASKCNVECQNVACLGKVTWPAPAKAMVTTTFTLVDYQASTPIADLDVKVCKRSDTACATPLATAKTAADGKVSGSWPTAPSGLDIYLEISGATVVSLLYFPSFSQPSQADGGSFNVNVFSKATFSLVSGILGVTSDPARGNVAAAAEDCSGSRMGGATLTASTADAMSKTFYVAGGLPSKTATETDATGSATLWNIPPGMVDLEVKTKSGASTGKSPVLVRAGFLTSTDAVPTP